MCSALFGEAVSASYVPFQSDHKVMAHSVKCPPKARQAYQQFMREAYATDIEPEVKKKWAEESGEGANVRTSKDPNTPFRARVARDVFTALPAAERDRYAAEAKAEAAAAHAAYEKAMNEPPSQTPQARQESVYSRFLTLLPINWWPTAQ
jgi:hypothetical protein